MSDAPNPAPQGSGPLPVLATSDDLILVTGAAGFIGAELVGHLRDRGFRRIRCLVRPSSNLQRLQNRTARNPSMPMPEIVTGNLLSRDDAVRVASGAVVVYHLAAGTGSKSFADAYLNSVVTTRNLIEATLVGGALKRLVSLSSFAVYSNQPKRRARVLDENSPVESHPQSRAEAYCYAKVKQDALVAEYGRARGLPYVLVRPGVVYGPGKSAISGRVGIDTFGFYAHLGGGNRIPFTYVENCAEAIALAGLVPGVDGQAFNVVDDDLPTSRQFLRGYKRHVRRFPSVPLPKFASFLFCWMWEALARASDGQLPAVFTRREWHAYWKRTAYSNAKLKRQLGWSPRIATADGLGRFFRACRESSHA